MYACTLPLTVEIACGDGFVDEDAGEECDPVVRESYIDACALTSRPDGEARCDEELCIIIDDNEQCAD